MVTVIWNQTEQIHNCYLYSTALVRACIFYKKMKHQCVVHIFIIYNIHSFIIYRYALRLRLCTVEGLRNSLYEYATMKADEIEQLEEEMRKLGTEPVILYDVVSDGDSDMESD